ncbi:MAG: hypothetical protein MJ087_04090 [Lachnospiraceae bacterium]|nr:hypothetical protein [Lachnospiraceae bacterium]
MNNQLDDEELDEVLRHIKNCPRCLEEVELFYTLSEGIRQMESDEITIYNFPESFEQKRHQDMKDVHGRKKTRQVADHFIMMVVLLIIFVGILYGLFHIYEYQMNLYSLLSIV